MTKKLHSFYAIFMAVIVLCTSTGFSLHFHCCGGKVKSASILVQASDCFELSGMDQKSCRVIKRAPVTSDCTLNKPHCCSDKSTHHIQEVEWWDVQDVQPSMDLVYTNQLFVARKLDLPSTFSHASIIRPPPESIPLWLQYSSFLL